MPAAIRATTSWQSPLARCAAAGAPLHLGSAGAEGQRLRPALGHQAVDAKSDAIMARPKLPAMLTLRGQAVTADALHCQRQAPMAFF